MHDLMNASDETIVLDVVFAVLNVVTTKHFHFADVLKQEERDNREQRNAGRNEQQVSLPNPHIDGRCGKLRGAA